MSFPNGKRSHRGERLHTAGTALLIAGLLVIVAGGWLSLRQLGVLNERFDRIDHTHQVMLRSEEFLSLLKDAETGQRGFILTGDESFLEPFTESRRRANETLDALGTLMGDNPDQVKRISDIRRLADLKFDELDSTILLRRQGDTQAAVEKVRTKAGQAYMDELRASVASILSTEENLLAQRQAELQATNTTLTGGLVIFILLIGLLSGGVALFNAALRNANRGLEGRVQDATNELAQTHQALMREKDQRLVEASEKAELLGRVVTVQETERQRIGRDIHDGLGQRLTAFRLNLEALKKDLDGTDSIEKAARRVEILQELGSALDSDVSYLAWQLRPSVLDEYGLAETLDAFVQEWSRHYDTEADFRPLNLDGERLDKDIETHLYRITEEALNNTAKYASAKHVSVLLERQTDKVQLVIEDDGLGFVVDERKAPKRPGGGMGLIGMTERARLIGGVIQIESSIGGGTTIFVRVPI